MDDFNLSSYDDFWDQLMLDGADSPPNGNFDTSWELPSPINTGSASLRNRPDFPFSPLTSNSYLNSHRTSQHRRRNTHSPSNLARTDSTSSHQPPRTNHEPLPDFPQETFNPTELDSSAFQVYPQSQPQQGSRLNQRTQLPGIDTAFPNYGFTDRPPSRFSWDAAAEDSLFVNADLWPDFNNSELNTVDANGFVDLTADSSPAHIMPPMTRKRRASATPVAAPSSPPSRSAKRRKTEDAGIKVEEPKVEKLDLVEVADDSGLSQVLEQQQVAAIKEQQGTQGNQAIRLSSLQCIICLEPMKDITVTHCGHLFCHTCIMEALIAGENQGEPGKATSKCPLCRKKVSRPKEKSRDKREVVPLEMKLSTRSSIAKGKAKAALS